MAVRLVVSSDVVLLDNWVGVFNPSLAESHVDLLFFYELLSP